MVLVVLVVVGVVVEWLVVVRDVLVVLRVDVVREVLVVLLTVPVLVVVLELIVEVVVGAGHVQSGRQRRNAPAGLPGGQERLPGGSHCSPASIRPLPQRSVVDDEELVVVVRVLEVLVRLVEVVVAVVVVVRGVATVARTSRASRIVCATKPPTSDAKLFTRKAACGAQRPACTSPWPETRTLVPLTRSRTSVGPTVCDPGGPDGPTKADRPMRTLPATFTCVGPRKRSCAACERRRVQNV
jgi:hypothetical protein